MVRSAEDDARAAEKDFQEAADLFGGLQIPYWAARTRHDRAVQTVETDPQRAGSIL